MFISPNFVATTTDLPKEDKKKAEILFLVNIVFDTISHVLKARLMRAVRNAKSPFG
jgi:hypothetical protein